MSERPIRRRMLLKTLGASAVAGSMAGCPSGGETAPDESESTATPTETPAQTTEETPQETTQTEQQGEQEEEQQEEREDDQQDEKQDEQEPSGLTVGTGKCALGSFPDASAEIGGDVTSDRTLGGGGRTTYRVTETLSVYDGATLTIEPGTKLEFAGGTGLTVWANSTLSAVGTCADPILMTGDQELPGTWAGVKFTDSNRVDNRLSHCRVEYGGDPDQGANLVTWDNSRVAVDNCTLADAETKNFSFNDSTTVADFSNTVVTGAGEYAGQCQPYMAQGLSDSSTYTGNGEDYVKVWASSLGEDYSGTWDGIDVPYRLVATSVSEELSISGDLTIADRSVFIVEQDIGITVYKGGSLTARSAETTEYSIVFASAAPELEPGFWRGITFEETQSDRNELVNVDIYEAGAFATRFAEEPAAVSLTRGANATIIGSYLGRTTGYGLYLDDDTTGTFTDNTIDANESAVYAHATAAHLVGDNSIHLNGDNAIVVRAGTITDDVTWEYIGDPYRIVENRTSGTLTVSDQGSLDISPGVTVEFAQDTALRADGSAALTAVGETTNPITFTGTQEQAGHWGGIFYVGTGNQDNVLNNCTIEYGGAYNAPFSDDPANVAVMRQGGSATIQNCTIRESGGAGLVREETATWTAANNTFENNTGQNTVIDPEP